MSLFLFLLCRGLGEGLLLRLRLENHFSSSFPTDGLVLVTQKGENSIMSLA